MTDQQIALFLSLVEIGSVTKTADEHYVSQPVVSKQIAALESALGFQLFNRRHKKVSVSASGQVFYDFFKRASLEYPSVVAHARRVQEAEFGSVELGLHSLLHFPAVERAVERLSEKYPNAKIRTHSHTVPFWQDEVSSGEIDVAVSDVPSTETHPGLASLELDRVREMSKSSVLMGLEATIAHMNHMARSVLDGVNIRTPEEIIAAYDAVTTADVQNMARELFNWDALGFSAVGRISSEEEYRNVLLA